MEAYKNTKRRKTTTRVLLAVLITTLIAVGAFYFWPKPETIVEPTIVPTFTTEPTATDIPAPPSPTPYPAPENWTLVPDQELEEWQKFKVIEDLTLFWDLLFHPEGRPLCSEAVDISLFFDERAEDLINTCKNVAEEGEYMIHMAMIDLLPSFQVKESSDGRVFIAVQLDTQTPWKREIHYWQDANIKEIRDTKQAQYGFALLPSEGMWKVNSYDVTYLDN